MIKIEKIVKKYFDKSISDHERAIFEGGIALGSLYHQFIGIPIFKDKQFIKDLENVIEQSMKLQPYREKIDVKIKKEMILSNKKHQYDYEILNDKHLDVRIYIKYGKAQVIVRMSFIKEINYCLMYIEKIKKF